MNNNSNTRIMVVLCTVPQESAQNIAKELINRHLAACVNILPVRSVYQWEGSVCNEPEELLIIKTTSESTRELTEVLVKIHPYDIPEVICLPVTQGYEGYLAWVTGEVKRKEKSE
jgi:periplasmic divalent cation tolerance protein